MWLRVIEVNCPDKYGCCTGGGGGKYVANVEHAYGDCAHGPPVSVKIAILNYAGGFKLQYGALFS